MSTKHKKIKLWAISQNCYVCGELIENFTLATLEHIIPRSKGGSNQQDNLALSHKVCNEIKSNHIEEKIWRREIREIQKRKEFKIWRKARSEFELKSLLERGYEDVSWARSTIHASFRFSEIGPLHQEDLQLQLKTLERLKIFDLTELIEASKKIDGYKTQPFWRLIFAILFIENFKRQGDVTALLHAIWRLNQFKASIKTPIIFLIHWDLLEHCRTLNQVAYERMLDYQLPGCEPRPD
jgi:hypothetical protein